jgi:hypothetical protein
VRSLSFGFVLVLLAVGCSSPRTAALARVDCDRLEVPLGPESRLGAMISVHAHALAGRDHVQTMALSDAATVLECDLRAGAAGARSRKRRAVAELAAFGRFEEFREELEILGVDVPALELAVRQLDPGTFPYLLKNPTVLEMVVSNLVAEQPPLGGLPAASALPPGAFASTDAQKACEWKQEEPFSVWNTGRVITIDGKISVDLAEAQVKRNVDPQRWDECSKLWDPPPDASAIVKSTGGGNFAPEPSPPTPGTDYGPVLLAEDFACTEPGCEAWFRNHLDIQNGHWPRPGKPGKTAYFVTYNLAGTGLDGCIGAAKGNCSGGTKVLVVTDEGWMEVWEENARTMVVTHKKVAFDNAIANGMSQALFGQAELARELAEVACCLKGYES